jgi:Na+/glutamate symporter
MVYKLATFNTIFVIIAGGIIKKRKKNYEKETNEANKKKQEI